MNYRQWKKSYKKKYGYNPPLEIDKKRQVKLSKQSLNQIKVIDYDDITRGIVNGISNLFILVGDTFTKLGKSIEIK